MATVRYSESTPRKTEKPGEEVLAPGEARHAARRAGVSRG
jgi:hypothetical protein